MTGPVIIEHDVAVIMRDGTRLVADVYRPADDARHPALVHRTPYGRQRAQVSYITLDPVQLARAGFAVVVQDTRSRGDSDGGTFEPFAEGADGYDTVQWAAAQPWSDGKVGAYGSSYMGATTLQAAVEAPPALATICAAQASCDYFEGRSYFGGAFEYGALVTTSLGAMLRGSLVRARLEQEEARATRRDVQAVLDGLATLPVPFPLERFLGGRTGLLGRLTPWFFDWADHRQPDDYWSRLSLAGRHSSIRAAGLHITSWYDQFHVGTIRNFSELQQHPAPEVRSEQFLLIGPWHHLGLPGYSLGTARVGDTYFGANSVLDLSALQQAWFESRLAGRGRFPQAAPVRYFLMGRGAWREAATWPPTEAAPTTLYLSRGRVGAQLARNLAETSGSDSYDYDPSWPVPTRGGAHLVLPALVAAGPVYQDAIAARPDVLVYETAPLDQICAIAGPVGATLHVTSDAPATDFTCRLADRDPSGRLLGICDGIARTSIGTDGSAEVAVSLGHTAYEFQPGHSMVLLVSSSNFPRFDPNPNTGESAFECQSPEVARQTVVYGPQHPSRLEFWVLPG